jgi:tetratricopeptide (TPR) repeat protein
MTPFFKVEGLAVWLQGTYRGKSIDFEALVCIFGERCTPLSRLLDREAWKSHEGYAYPLAGSFTGFLISRYGREQYREFFAKTSERDFEQELEKVFGQDLLRLERQWLGQLLGRRSEFEPGVCAAIAERRAEGAYSRWELHRCIDEVETSVRGGFVSARGLRLAGRACQIIGEYAKAGEFFRQALLTWTEDSRIARAELWFELRKCCDLEGHRDDAKHAYRQALGEAAVAGADDASARRSAEKQLQRPYSESEWFEELRSWERD